MDRVTKEGLRFVGGYASFRGGGTIVEDRVEAGVGDVMQGCGRYTNLPTNCYAPRGFFLALLK